MTTPSGAISFSDVQTEFGGSNPISLSEYYRGGSNVPSVGAGTSGIPTSSTISADNLRGRSKTATVTYDVLGAGGGGGAGYHSRGASPSGGNGTAPSGGDASLSGSGFTTITSTGGSGGHNGAFSWDAPTAGQSSAHGTGGAAGATDNPGGDGSGSGAGGGGGGGRNSVGAAGQGGYAGTRNTGSFTLVYGTTLTMTIGSGGTGTTNSPRNGGDGSGGRVSLSWDSESPVYTSSTTRVVN